MILANARERLTAQDLDLVVEALSRGDGARRSAWADRLATEGIDALLDQPELPAVLVKASSLVGPSPALFWYVAVRHTLRDAGVDDVRLSDYLASLLWAFGRRDRAERIATHDDATYRYLTDMVVDIESAPGRRGFLLRAHLGNYSLWLAGVFPDYIIARRERKGGPDLTYYEALGAQGYRMARDHDLAQRFGLADVFDRAAQQFSRIRVAFNRISDRFLFPNFSSVDRLLRQVAEG